MKSEHVKLLCIANGEMDAEIKKNYLASFGITAILYEESLGRLYGLVNTQLGEVEIYVKNEDFDAAAVLMDKLKT